MTESRSSEGMLLESNEMLPEIKGPLPGPKGRAIIDRDHAIMSESYTRDYPFVMERGEGVVVWDVDGNRFLDMCAGIAVCATGHSHPRVVAAVKAQAEKFLHMSGTDFYYDVQVSLAERLAAHAPMESPKRVFFTNSGTESIEGAIKLARHHTGGHHMIAFFGAFHGRSMGALSLTASKNVQRKGFGPFLPSVSHVRYGERIEYIEEYVIKKSVDPKNLSAMFVEAIQGEGGYVLPSSEWLQGLRDLCTRYGILLVVDEVQSGMGRTGKMFACEHFDIQPDIICTAKGIASGMPLGAFIAPARIMNWKPGQHGTTFGGNPVACAAGLATMDLLEESLMENARVVGAHFLNKLKELETRQSMYKGARGLGLMIAIDVVDSQGRLSTELRNHVVMEAFKKGVLVLGCGVAGIRFAPGLTITTEQTDCAVDTLEAIARETRH